MRRSRLLKAVLELHLVLMLAMRQLAELEARALLGEHHPLALAVPIQLLELRALRLLLQGRLLETALLCLCEVRENWRTDLLPH